MNDGLNLTPDQVRRIAKKMPSQMRHARGLALLKYTQSVAHLGSFYADVRCRACGGTGFSQELICPDGPHEDCPICGGFCKLPKSLGTWLEMAARAVKAGQVIPESRWAQHQHYRESYGRIAGRPSKVHIPRPYRDTELHRELMLVE